MLAEAQIALIQGRFRIPVDSFIPSQFWIISLCRESLMPTDQELAQLRSYCNFIVKKTYNEEYGRRILRMRLPYDPGHFNTIIFRKGAPFSPKDCGWFFREPTRKFGLSFLPAIGEGYHSHTLAETMDGYETRTPAEWKEWKRKHHPIFPALS
jgi:hypothetical protein